MTEEANAAIEGALAGGAIRHAAEESMSRLVEPWSPDDPVTISVDFTPTVQAEMAPLVPGSERTGPRQVEFSDVAMAEVFLAWQASFNLAQSC